MDWKVFATTFMTIFLAELGDKTQFAAMAVSAASSKTFTVLLAVISALALAGALGVLAGSFLGQYIAPENLRRMAGAVFVAMGLWMLFLK